MPTPIVVLRMMSTVRVSRPCCRMRFPDDEYRTAVWATLTFFVDGQLCDRPVAFSASPHLVAPSHSDGEPLCTSPHLGDIASPRPSPCSSRSYPLFALNNRAHRVAPRSR